MTFLVFSVLPAPDSPLPIELRESLVKCGYVLTPLVSAAVYHSAPLWGSHEGTNTKKKQQQTKCEAPDSSLSLFPMAHQRPDKSRFITTAYPGHLAALRAKCFRHQGEAAVDLGAKGTYMCSLEISLGGSFCSTNSPTSLLRWKEASISLNQIRKATIQSRKACWEF